MNYQSAAQELMLRWANTVRQQESNAGVWGASSLIRQPGRGSGTVTLEPILGGSEECTGLRSRGGCADSQKSPDQSPSSTEGGASGSKHSLRGAGPDPVGSLDLEGL